MCRPFIFIVLQVLALKCATSYPNKDYILAYIPVEELAYLSPENLEAMPFPYYDNAFFFDPWYYQNVMMQNVRSPYQQTTRPVSFGGQVKAKGAVTFTGGFGNDGHGIFTSYSAPPTPLTVTPQPVLPTTSSLLAGSTLLTSTTLPTITSLPAVTLPSTTISHTFIDTAPSTVSVPTTPMPFIVVTTTVPNDVGLNGNVANPVKFSGMVPASVVVQYTSAQVIPYGVPNRSINIGNNARGMPNGMAMGRGLANGIGRTMPTAANNMARGNTINRQNIANPYYANNNFANNNAIGNIANANLANIVESNLANPFISANQVLTNEITATALENFANANQMANIGTPGVITNMPKGATYNFGNSPIPVTVTTSLQHGKPVGINILADNLEVNGLVTVVGRMPIFGAVTINGNVPSDGKASVNYSCGSPTAV